MGGTLEDFEAWASQEEPLIKVMKFAMSLSLLCSQIAPPEHVEHSNGGGLPSLLGAPQVKSGRKALKLLKPSVKRRLPISFVKKRCCQCLFILVLLVFVLYALFAVVLPRLSRSSSINALQIDDVDGTTNSSTVNGLI